MSGDANYLSEQLIAEYTSKMLLEIGAVNFRPEQPYILTSGWASPVYIDCRKIISYPRVRRALMSFAETTIYRNIGYESLDGIAGGETAGIPFAAWVADRLMLPMQYVRKKPKGFGRDAQIEGSFAEGDRILLVEDLSSDGRSKIKFCNVLRDAGAKVGHTFVVFNYGVFPDSDELLKSHGIEMHFLANWASVVEAAEKGGYFSSDAIEGVKSFLDDPVAWSANNGGIDGSAD